MIELNDLKELNASNLQTFANGYLQFKFANFNALNLWTFVIGTFAIFLKENGLVLFSKLLGPTRTYYLGSSETTQLVVFD